MSHPSHTFEALANALGIDLKRLPPGTLIDGMPADAAAAGIQVQRKPGQIRITIPGPPPGKPRMTRRDKWAKRPAVARYRAWCDRVRSGAGTIPAASSVTSVDWCAYFEPPRSWPKKKRVAAIMELHRDKPDRDNIDKAVLDCLWPRGDSAIAQGLIVKRWAWVARMEINIRYQESVAPEGRLDTE